MGNTMAWMLIALAVLAVMTLAIISLFPDMIRTSENSGASSMDKCKPGSGYTEQSWKEHMSHHPDLYRECLD